MGSLSVTTTWILLILAVLAPTVTLGAKTKKPAKNTTSTQTSTQSSRIRYPCQCYDGECGCCTGNILSNFNINVQNRACANVTYYPEDFEFHIRLILNNNVFYQRRMSGKNPPPLCATMPYFSNIKMCVIFSNVYVVGRNLHMCMNLEGKYRDNTLYSFSFDCIRIGTSGIAWLSPEQGGGLGPPKPVVENVTESEDYDAVVASEGDDIQSAKLLF